MAFTHRVYGADLNDLAGLRLTAHQFQCWVHCGDGLTNEDGAGTVGTAKLMQPLPHLRDDLQAVGHTATVPQSSTSRYYRSSRVLGQCSHYMAHLAPLADLLESDIRLGRRRRPGLTLE